MQRIGDCGFKQWCFLNIYRTAIKSIYTRSRCRLKRLHSEPISRLKENQNKEIFLKTASSQTFPGNASSKQELGEFRRAWYRISDHRHTFTEAATEKCSLKIKCTLNTHSILRSIVPLRRSWVQSVESGPHQGDFRMI